MAAMARVVGCGGGRRDGGDAGGEVGGLRGSGVARRCNAAAAWRWRRWSHGLVPAGAHRAPRSQHVLGAVRCGVEPTCSPLLEEDRHTQTAAGRATAAHMGPAGSEDAALKEEVRSKKSRRLRARAEFRGTVRLQHARRWLMHMSPVAHAHADVAVVLGDECHLATPRAWRGSSTRLRGSCVVKGRATSRS
jgi:hypothetical protein